MLHRWHFVAAPKRFHGPEHLIDVLDEHRLQLFEYSMRIHSNRMRIHLAQVHTGQDVIHSDSQWSINMTTGKWMPSKGHRNTRMVANLRALWRKVLRARPGEVSLKHVRSHTNLPGNELADWLAEMAADDQEEVDITSAEQWLTHWLADRKRQGTAEGGRGSSSTHSPNTLGDPTGIG